jgi:uncharacterized membrane-anchored protein YhcB (DUF1043 family)
MLKELIGSYFRGMKRKEKYMEFIVIALVVGLFLGFILYWRKKISLKKSQIKIQLLDV